MAGHVVEAAGAPLTFRPVRTGAVVGPPVQSKPAEQFAVDVPAASDALFPGFNYVARLRERMEKAGFPPAGDRLFQLVSKAHEAMRQLSSELHYLSCSGV